MRPLMGTTTCAGKTPTGLPCARRVSRKEGGSWWCSKCLPSARLVPPQRHIDATEEIAREHTLALAELREMTSRGYSGAEIGLQERRCDLLAYVLDLLRAVTP
jgi:hypothetical protein